MFLTLFQMITQSEGQWSGRPVDYECCVLKLTCRQFQLVVSEACQRFWSCDFQVVRYRGGHLYCLHLDQEVK